MQYFKICVLITCFVALQMVSAYPEQRISQRLNTENTSADLQLTTLTNLYKYERTLNRLRRALEELEYEQTADDMELAEINVFRPLFRYRAEVARQVKNPQQFG